MTDDEISVLNYVSCGMGGPETIVMELRPVFFDLIERGLIRPVVLYELTDCGEKALETKVS